MIDTGLNPEVNDWGFLEGGTREGITLEASLNGREFWEVTGISNGEGYGINRQKGTIPISVDFPAVKATFFRLSSYRSYHYALIRFSGAGHIRDWKHKANFETGGDEAPPTGEVPPASVIDPESVIELTGNMDAGGNLNWDAPMGNWMILRIGYTAIGTVNIAAPEGGGGLEIDKFSKEAMDVHFNSMMGELLPTLEPMARKNKVYLEIDSWEVGVQNWTPAFPEEFSRLAGYDLVTYLPAMTGRVVGSAEISERFLWEIRRIQANLVADNYYGRFHELCKKHNITSYNEPYNPGPFEEMQVSSRVDASMAEFWFGLSTWFPENYEHHRTVRLCASVAHAHGRKIVGAEAFSAETPSGKWQAYPFPMKELADRYFTEGLTRMVIHRFAQQPHPDSSVAPGMTMSFWGMHFERTNTWWEQGKNFLEYVTRCQHVLQQGMFVADLVYFTGEGAPKEAKIFREILDPPPPDGYDYDMVNRETILYRMQVREGRIVLPDGMNYRVMVIQDFGTMTLELLQKLHTMVSQGMILYGSKPFRTPGLEKLAGKEAIMMKLADEVWGDLDGNTVTERKFGMGRIFWGEPLEGVLKKLGCERDFKCTSRSGDAPVRYIHRTIGALEVYFVCNGRRDYEDLVCTFRVRGRRPEFWDAVTGTITPAVIYDEEGGCIKVPVQLSPYGSVFVVFRDTGSGDHIRQVTRNGIPVIGAIPFPKPEQVKYESIRDNFTVCGWFKPEIDIMLGSSGTMLNFRQRTDYYAIFPPSGGALYGEGHEAAGLSVGRDGVDVWHREGRWPYRKMYAQTAIEGWTHVAVVYKYGIPSVYVNGRNVPGQFTGEATGKTVHPGIGMAFLHEGASYYNGDMTRPELFAEPLTEDRIRQLAGEDRTSHRYRPSPFPVRVGMPGVPGLTFMENGQYVLEDNRGHTRIIDVSGIHEPLPVGGSWNVRFPEGSGAPANITLERLESLHNHEIPGVRYFSGTAEYSTRFILKKSELACDKRLFLDLGRIEVIAGVMLNGKNLGVLWTRPYQAEITGAVKAGSNDLVVKVVNLWPNRLIGDEQLPPEYEYEKFNGDMGASIARMPNWYLRGEPRPKGLRVAFSVWQHYRKDDPLLESGLIGPVSVKTAISRSLI